MSDSGLQTGRTQAVAVVLGQVMLGAVVTVAGLALWGARAGMSAAVGAGIGIAATSLMALAMLRHGAGASAQRVAWSFLSGWLVKVVFTVALLVVALRSPRVAGLPLLAGYAVTYIGYWLGGTRVGGTRTDKTFGVAD